MESDSEEDEMIEEFESFSIHFGLNGSDFQPESPEEHATQQRRGKYHYFPRLSEFLDSHLQIGEFDDVAELCGGAAETGALLVRRGYRGGPNFDIIAGFNMRSKGEQDRLYTYMDKCKPNIFILSTPCTGMKGVQRHQRRESSGRIPTFAADLH